MLSRNLEEHSPDEYFKDTMTTSVPASKSVFDHLGGAFGSGFLAERALSKVLPNQNNIITSPFDPTIPLYAMDAMAGLFEKTPVGDAIKNVYQMAELEDYLPGQNWIGQKGANYLASMIGSGLSPEGMMMGGLGRVTATAIGKGALNLLPEATSLATRKPLKNIIPEAVADLTEEQIAKITDKQARSVATISKGFLESTGTMAGYAVPDSVMNNYNENKNTLDYTSTIKQIAAGGVFGFGLHTIPFLYGLIKGDFRASGDIDKALKEGRIDQTAYDWWKDYHAGADKNELATRATEILKKKGINVDNVTNNVPVNYHDAETISNLKNIAFDALTSDSVPSESRAGVINFIANASVDSLRDDPNMMNGIRGVIEHSNEKMKFQEERLAEHDNILNDYLYKSLKDNMQFSQKDILKTIKKAQFEQSHVDLTPLTIPENISKHSKILQRIAELKEKLKKSKAKDVRQGKEHIPNKQTVKRIGELENSLPKILTPKEEIKHIHESLITKDGLKKGWENSNEYHRLLDLSEVWHNAKTLLDRVHHQAEYERQHAFRLFLDTLVKLEDSSAGKISNPQDAVDYLKNRLKEAIYSDKEFHADRAEVENKVNELKSNETTNTLDEVKETGAKEQVKEFENILNKSDEFKSKAGVFKSLIQCILGAQSG